MTAGSSPRSKFNVDSVLKASYLALFCRMRRLDVETFGRDSLSQRGNRVGYSGVSRYGGRGRSNYNENNAGYSRSHSSGRVYRIRGST